jgi:hypothetical protein
VVTAQQGAIRFGGYHEIEVKGAVAFDGPTLGVGVRPILSEKLVKQPPELVGGLGECPWHVPRSSRLWLFPKAFALRAGRR